MLCQRRRQARSDDAAEGRARGNEPKETLALLGVENIDHQGPEDRHDKQIENRSPKKKRSTHPNMLLWRGNIQKRGEEKQVDHEKAVSMRDEFCPGPARDQRCKRRIDCDHAEERAGEKPLKILD